MHLKLRKGIRTPEKPGLLLVNLLDLQERFLDVLGLNVIPCQAFLSQAMLNNPDVEKLVLKLGLENFLTLWNSIIWFGFAQEVIHPLLSILEYLWLD